MINFKRGLPGAGKSYDAIKDIVQALKAGRQVFTNIDGINYAEFSKFLKMPEHHLKGAFIEIEVPENELEHVTDVICKPVKMQVYGSDIEVEVSKYYVLKRVGLIFELTEDDLKRLYDVVLDNSLVVIDEVQDHYPAKTAPLSAEMTSFITQHRHRGIDIILMGQDEKDCHNLWRRRIDKLVHFTKQDAIGRPHAYKWQSFKLSGGASGSKFTPLRSGSDKYEACYFPLYSSHVSSTIQTENYADDRTNVLKSSAFTFWLPLGFLAVCFAIYYLWHFFHPSQPVKPVVSSAISAPAPVSAPVPVSAPSSTAPASAPVPVSAPSVKTFSQPSDYFKKIADSYELELVAIIEDKHPKQRQKNVFIAVIQAFDSEHRLIEEFKSNELIDMGWQLSRTSYGLIFSHDKSSYLIRQKPHNQFGQVGDNVRNSPQITGKK